MVASPLALEVQGVQGPGEQKPLGQPLGADPAELGCLDGGLDAFGDYSEVERATKFDHALDHCGSGACSDHGLKECPVDLEDVDGQSLELAE